MNPSRLFLNKANQRPLTHSLAHRNSLQLAFVLSSGRQLPRSQSPYVQPALFVFASNRYLNTDTVTAGSSPVVPPPGFNAIEAKRSLSRDLAPGKRPKSETTVPATAKKQEGLVTAAAKSEPREVKESILTSITNAKSLDRKKDVKRTTIWQKIKHGVQHFWDGTKLLGAEIKISSKLALKMAAGYELSRRERRQLERTVKDLGRLVPFSVFIIVPAGELFLPVALKFFPNLLPSTYEDQKAKDLKSSKLRSTRKDVSNFLRTTMREGGIQLSAKTRQREEFAQFFQKIRSSGESPSHEDVVKVCKIFRDDLTLDNLSRAQLVGMCRYMNLNTFGTDAILRYHIRHRMRQIKRDDRAISYEGVDSLSVPELQTACASRGIRTHGVSPGRLRDDLNTWLELRLKHGLPSTLLVLSNAFMYQGKESEIESHYDALVAVLSSIPEELYHEIELEVNTAEGAATNKQRLEVLREQQELIEEENEQRSAGETSSKRNVKDDQDIDEKEEDKTVVAESSEEATSDDQYTETVTCPDARQTKK